MVFAVRYTELHSFAAKFYLTVERTVKSESPRARTLPLIFAQL
jgi:hypothetical protein